MFSRVVAGQAWQLEASLAGLQALTGGLFSVFWRGGGGFDQLENG